MRRAKILNDPRDVVNEVLEGLVAASHGKLRPIEGATAVVRSRLAASRIGLVVGGGSGHEPLFAGFVGEGLADAAACGNVFAAPTPDIILAATRAVDRGKGVLYVYGNYAGDNLSFDMAVELAAEEGISTATVRVWDDRRGRSSGADGRSPRDRRRPLRHQGRRRGLRASPRRSRRRVRQRHEPATTTRSIGVAVAPGSIPETGKPTFELGDDEIEIGMGLHGEPGVARAKLGRADPLIADMLGRILADLPFASGDDVCLLVNDIGSTTWMELLVATRKAHAVLDAAGIQVHDTVVGSFCTSQEMAGLSLTLMKLDPELKRCYDAPARSVAFTR